MCQYTSRLLTSIINLLEIEMNKQHYVYIHFKGDTLEPFYIGKGIGRRINAYSSRSLYWKRIVKKHGYSSDFLEYFDTHEAALAYEVEMISFFRAEGFKLCNLTSGGDGTLGYKRSPELNERVAVRNRGTKRSHKQIARLSEAHLNYSPAVRQRMSTSREGCGNPGYKGDILATNLIDGSTITLQGVKEIEAAGFSNTCVYRCIHGEFKQHKGYTFTRQTTN
jgi:hypothetical protein